MRRLLRLGAALLAALHLSVFAQPQSCREWAGQFHFNNDTMWSGWQPTRAQAAAKLFEVVQQYWGSSVEYYRCAGDPPDSLRSYTSTVRLADAGTDDARVEIYWKYWDTSKCEPTWWTGFQLYGYQWTTCPATIELIGDSHTKVLPAGPSLPQTARVTRNGAPLSGNTVSITITRPNNTTTTFTGVTNDQGEYGFDYVPPLHKPTTDQILATCSNCSNTAQKTVVAEACDACEGKRANPISTATGEKLQSESDWADAAAHPLTLTRHYRSFGAPPAGMGSHWSHDYAPVLATGSLNATVKLGDGSKIVFRRASTASAWLADNGRDSLADTASGPAYTRASDETRFQFDASGRLLGITQRNGWTYTLTYSGSQLQQVTNAFGRSLQFSYTGNLLTSVTTPDSQSIAYGYDSAGRLQTVTYPGGATRSYHYEDSNHPQALTGITDESNTRHASFGYDAQGRAISSTHAGNAQPYTVSYPPAAASSLSAGGGSAGYQLTTQVTDPLGNQQQLTFQGGDGQVRLKEANGAFEGEQVASRTFTTGMLPATETDFLGVQTMHTWDTDRKLKTSTTEAAGRPESRTTQTQWHPSFRLPVLITEPGRTTAYTYDGLGNPLTETISDTATGQSRTWAWTYTTQGLPATMTDPAGGVWRYAYDSAGNRTSARDPLGHETTFSFDAAGRLLTERQPNGLTTRYSHDARGRVLSVQRGDETTTYAYTPHGLLASVRLPSGYQVSYSYDAAQRLVGASDSFGATISYTLDAAGNRIREEVKDAAGNIALATTRTINALNRVASVAGAQGQATQIGYDANGQAISQTDPLNQTTRQTLDALKRTTATTFPDNASAAQGWSALDALTQVTDPKGVQTTYTYNAFGEVLSETSPDIGTIKYTRDAAGNVVATEDAKGQIAQITRDALGRPTRIDYAPGHTASFTYDSQGHITEVQDKSGTTRYTRDSQGRILTKTQTVQDNPSNPSEFTVTYGYTGGELTSIQYPSGLKVTYKRNAGRITGIDAQAPGGTPRRPKPVIPLVSNLAYTALEQPRSWSWFNGDSANRSFDQDGRMVGNEFASYTYDPAGRITAITQHLWASVTTGGSTTLATTPLHWQIGYDSRNRLSSFTRQGAETRYTYDANSNRLTATDKLTSDTDLDGQFDSEDFTQTTSQQLAIEGTSNRLLGMQQTITRQRDGRTRSTASTTVNYAIDANGALVSDGLRTFEYDEANRLAKVRITRDGEAASVRYLSNAMSQRVFKGEPTSDATLPDEQELGEGFIAWLRKNFRWMFERAQASTSIGTAYLYADGDLPQWALLGEYDNGSAAARGRSEYIWLPTSDGAIPIGMLRGGQFYAIHTDHLGTSRLMTNAENKPVWQWPYSAFGNNKPTGVLQATANPKAAITNQPVLLRATNPQQALDFRFPGQHFDDATQMADNIHRTYWMLHGRYTQADPIGMGGGWSRFSYANLSPLRYADPMGLFAPQKHANITAEALRRLPVNCPNLTLGVVLADVQPTGTQDPKNAHWHAMRDGTDPKDTREAAAKRFGIFIDNQMAACSCAALARALHAAQDLYAGGHRNFQPWAGGNALGLASPEHLKADNFPTPAEEEGAVRESVEMLKKFRENCECKR